MSETIQPRQAGENNKHDRAYERVELNGHWVEYRFRDSIEGKGHVIAFPRAAIISDETIAELKRLDDDEASSIR